MSNSIQLKTYKTPSEIFASARKIFSSTFFVEIENDNYMIFKNSSAHPIFTLFIENGTVTVVDVNPILREDGEASDFQEQIKKLV